MEFTEEQQEYINKLVGEARTKAREKALEEAQGIAETKLTELRSQFAVDLEAHEQFVASVLEDKLQALGDRARQAVESIPNGVDKIAWLNANAELFTTNTSVGTPKPGKAASTRQQPVAPSRYNIRL